MVKEKKRKIIQTEIKIENERKRERVREGGASQKNSCTWHSLKIRLYYVDCMDE